VYHTPATHFYSGQRDIKTGDDRQGHNHFPAPKTPGLYHFKYFIDGSFNEVAESDIVHIGPQLSLESKIIQDPEDGKTKIEVSYKLNSGELSEDDWFGLYNATESNNKRYLTYHPLGVLKNP